MRRTPTLCSQTCSAHGSGLVRCRAECAAASFFRNQRHRHEVRERVLDPQVALDEAATAMRRSSPKGSNSLTLGSAQGELTERWPSALKAHDKRWPAAGCPIGPRRCVAPSARGWSFGWFVFMGRCPMLDCLSPSGCLPSLSRPLFRATCGARRGRARRGGIRRWSRRSAKPLVPPTRGRWGRPPHRPRSYSRDAIDGM